MKLSIRCWRCSFDVKFPRRSSFLTTIENQIWRLVPDGGGPYYFFESKLNGFVIDILGADTDPAVQLIAYPRKTTGTANQVWKFA